MKISDADDVARDQAQALHDKLMEAPAIFASSFYLADAAGMVRLVAWEPGANDAKIVRASVIMPREAFVKLCEMGPKFIADVAAAKARTNEGKDFNADT